MSVVAGKGTVREPSGEPPPRKRHRRVNHGSRGNKAEPRPPAESAPKGLLRGTDDYRRWEAAQVLALTAMGLGKPAILERLGMTPAEWEQRRDLIRTEAKPGDALHAWAFFQAACLRRTIDCERVLLQAREGSWEERPNPAGGRPIRTKCVSAPNPNAAIGALRLLHDIDVSVVEQGVKLGVLRPGTGDEPPPGGAAGSAPPPSVHAQFLVNILQQAGAANPDLSGLSEAGVLAAFERLSSEFAALRQRAAPPSLVPENPR